MKKFLVITLSVVFMSGSYCFAHKTAYGKATQTGKIVKCPNASATCYTVYDNGTIDVFFEAGTSHGTVGKIIYEPTGDEVNYEELPEEMDPNTYIVELADEGGE